ncbi:hypothetical protein [Nevskia ramosa]|uniref:hypothetical protein n=1 Tax=Nevskia ramosa TaxID=64002 RepID=UPI0012EBA66F|nr:hypothetical protein [Nevskia ramosa]
MNASNELLDRIAKRHGLKSDYAIAKALSTSTSRISSYRTGRTQMDDDSAVQAAILAGEDPAIVIASIHCERAKTTEARALWERVAALARGANGVASRALSIGAVLTLGLLFGSASFPNSGARLAPLLTALGLYIIFIVHLLLVSFTEPSTPRCCPRRLRRFNDEKCPAVAIDAGHHAVIGELVTRTNPWTCHPTLLRPAAA